MMECLRLDVSVWRRGDMVNSARGCIEAAYHRHGEYENKVVGR